MCLKALTLVHLSLFPDCFAYFSFLPAFTRLLTTETAGGVIRGQLVIKLSEEQNSAGRDQHTHFTSDINHLSGNTSGFNQHYMSEIQSLRLTANPRAAQLGLPAAKSEGVIMFLPFCIYLSLLWGSKCKMKCSKMSQTCFHYSAHFLSVVKIFPLNV